MTDTAKPHAESYCLDRVGVTLSSADGPREILRDVSFTAAPGDFVSVIGRSGTGKTTLLRLLGGLLIPTTGVVSLDGKEIRKPPEGVVTVFQDYASALLPWRTIRKNVGLPLERQMSAAERNLRVDEALSLVGLESRADDFPWRLSGGMQQRVQIARALALKPSVLLMDEPFGALDALTRASLQDELLRVQAETKATVVFITHDLDEAIYLSSQVLLISGNTPGEVVATHTTALPYPRDQLTTRDLPRYAQLRHDVALSLGVSNAT